MTNTPRPAVTARPYVDPSPERGVSWSFARNVDPHHTALLVVDVQNDFCHPEGAWARVRQDSYLGEALGNLRGLLPCVRQAGVPVLHVRTVFNEWTVSTLIADQWRALGIGPVCWEGSWGAEFYEVLPEPGDRITTKFRPSGFSETDLELSLRAKEVETLLVAGMGIWGGVYETALDGLARDHPVVVLEDCIAGGRAHDRDVLHDLFRRYWGKGMTSAAVLHAWGPSRG